MAISHTRRASSTATPGVPMLRAALGRVAAPAAAAALRPAAAPLRSAAVRPPRAPPRRASRPQPAGGCGPASTTTREAEEPAEDPASPASPPSPSPASLNPAPPTGTPPPASACPPPAPAAPHGPGRATAGRGVRQLQPAAVSLRATLQAAGGPLPLLLGSLLPDLPECAEGPPAQAAGCGRPRPRLGPGSPGRRRRPRGRSHLDSRRGGSVRPPPAAVVPGPGLSSSPGPDAGPAGHPARPFPSPASRAGWLGSVPGPRARALRAPPDRVGG